MKRQNIRWRAATLILSLLFATASLRAQDMNGYEYWFDGNRNNLVRENLAPPPGDVLTVATTIDINTLTDGFHTISVRMRGENGWSGVSTYRFFKKTIDPDNAYGYEYWFDGNRDNLVSANLAQPAGAVLTIDPTADINTLTDGFHTISVRMRGANGWSGVSTYRFFKKTIDPDKVYGYEYWFDGNRDNLVSANLAQPAGGVLTIDPAVHINTLTDGFHTISVRMRGENGWSAASTYRFYKNDKIPGGDISAWEYWWDDDLAGAKRSEVNPPAQHIFFLNEPADMSALCKGIHALNLRFYGSNGWSSAIRYSFEKKTPKVGEEVADFEIIADGGQVSFVNTSQNGTGYRWFFGDGATDTLANPYHDYGIGTYTVTLVNYGFCQNDTMRRELVVPGISGYTPKKGGKNAVVTVALTGVGFNAGMDVRLKRAGQADIEAEEFVQNVGQMTAKFKFQNALPGKWDLVVDYPGPTDVTFAEGFTIEDSTYAKLSVKITANWRMRTGVKNPMTVTVVNEGNADARCIPLNVGGLPEGTKIEPVDEPLDILPHIPVFDIDTLDYPTDSLPVSYTDEDGKEIKPLILAEIPAGQSRSVQFHVTPPPTSTPTPYNIHVKVGKTFLEEVVDGDDHVMTCFKAIAEEAIKLVLPGQTDFIQCVSNIGLTMSDFHDAALNLVYQDNTATKSVIEVSGLFFGILQTGAICAKAAGTVTPMWRLATFLNKSIKAYNNASLIGQCLPVFETIAEDIFSLLIGNSFDPNIKVGPGNGSAGHFYATASGPLVYIIQCENDTSALFAAQTVTIIDTLDLTKLDVSTFRFTHVNVAGYGITLNISGTQFIRDIYLPTGVIARVSGHLNLLTGVVTWVMRTIDPATGQVTADPIAGILQPNFNPPEGDASVGFSIHKLPGLPDDVLIENRAVIIFDSNDPILTNTWGVVSDNVPPVSQINPLPAMQDSVNVHLGWKGEDNHSGVQYYRIYVSDNSGSYYQWRSNEADTSAVFTGQAGHTYRFYSIAVDSAGNVEPPPAGFDAEIAIGGGVGTHAVIRHGYRLEQNVPNPFSNQTRIDFTLPEFCPQVRLRVVDVPGRTVREFVFRNQAPGKYSVFLRAEELAPGLYFYQLLTPGVWLTKRMVVEK